MFKIRFLLATALGGLLLGTACSKKTEEAAGEEGDPAVTAAAAALPPVPPLRGGEQVLTALQAQDFMGAVRALMQVKMSVTADQQLQYIELMRTVKNAIVDNMATNPNAEKAYAALRAMEIGR